MVKSVVCQARIRMDVACCTQRTFVGGGWVYLDRIQERITLLEQAACLCVMELIISLC